MTNQQKNSNNSPKLKKILALLNISKNKSLVVILSSVICLLFVSMVISTMSDTSSSQQNDLNVDSSSLSRTADIPTQSAE